jgi:hypothetical protein
MVDIADQLIKKVGRAVLPQIAAHDEIGQHILDSSSGSALEMSGLMWFRTLQS